VEQSDGLGGERPGRLAEIIVGAAGQRVHPCANLVQGHHERGVGGIDERDQQPPPGRLHGVGPVLDPLQPSLDLLGEPDRDQLPPREILELREELRIDTDRSGCSRHVIAVA
jgi:hypothetical protein